MNFYTNFNSSYTVKHLISINILIYTAIFVFPQYKIENILSLYNPLLDNRFEFHQIFTHMFIHSKRLLFHIIFNMLALFMFGGQIETILGMKKFLLLYFISGVFAAFMQIFFNTSFVYFFIKTFDIEKIEKIIFYINKYQKTDIYNFIYSPMMGSSGAVSGIVGAFARFFPEHKIFILPFPFPIRVKKALIIFVFGSAISAVFNIAPGIAHFAHIGGIISGYTISYYLIR